MDFALFLVLALSRVLLQHDRRLFRHGQAARTGNAAALAAHNLQHIAAVVQPFQRIALQILDRVFGQPVNLLGR